MTLLFICGLYSLAFAIFHIFFWKIFDWKAELKKLSFANKGIMQILNSRMIYFFCFVAFLCFFYPNELAESRLGNALLLGISLFWLGRTIEQFIFLRANDKYLHMLTMIFAAGTILYALPVISRL